MQILPRVDAPVFIRMEREEMEEKNGRRRILLHNGVIVTMDDESRVYSNGAIVVEADKIIALGRSSEMFDRFSRLADENVDLEGRIVLPGFINTHVHTSQQLARGIADDVDLVTWLHERIWPYESNMTEEDSYLSTLLCGIELIRSGVTCFAEAGGQHVPGMARAVELLGMRACLSESIMDSGKGLPTVWSARSTDNCIRSQKELYSRYHGSADGRIRVWFGIRQVMNATDQLLLETRNIAKELKTGVHMHVAEISYENQNVASTRGVNGGTVTYLEKVGLLQSNLLAAHSVWVNDHEIGLLSKAGVKVSHCPASAMRMLGFAPIKEMLDTGICVSLGTDGAPSNNRMSIVDEMYVASLINKGKEAHTKGATDPTALPAEIVLKMVTINGARSVLWDDEIGSFDVGKKADLVVVKPCTWSMVPVHDCISSLVYCMRTENIDAVMCNGQWIMRDQRILTVEEDQIVSQAMHASNELLKRAGIKIPTKMNFVLRSPILCQLCNVVMDSDSQSYYLHQRSSTMANATCDFLHLEDRYSVIFMKTLLNHQVKQPKVLSALPDGFQARGLVTMSRPAEQALFMFVRYS